MNNTIAVYQNRKNRLHRMAKGSGIYSFSQSGANLSVSVPAIPGARYQWYEGDSPIIGETERTYVSSSPMTDPIRCKVLIGTSYEFYDFIRKPRNPLFLGSKLLGFINGKDASKMTLVSNRPSALVDSYNAGVTYSQATEANRPLLTSEGLFFDDSNDFLSYTLAGDSFYNVTGGIHVFCFSKITSTTAGGGDSWLGEFNTSSTSMGYQIVIRSSAAGTPSLRNRLASFLRNSGTFYLSGTTASSSVDAYSTEFNCQEIQDLKGAGYSNWINGVADRVNIADAVARSGLTWTGNVRTIGAVQLSGGPTQYIGGVLHSLVIVKAAEITEADRQEVLAWGLQDCGVASKLPSTNPFK